MNIKQNRIQRKQLPLVDQGLGQMGRDHAHTQAVTNGQQGKLLEGQARGQVVTA